MLSADISMELHLDDLPNIKEDLLTVGVIHAHDVHALCNDVAAMIFPSAITPPTEETISAMTRKLVAVVSDIEAQLLDCDRTSELSRSWSLLAESGFLRERDLIDFMLARVAEDRLDAKLSGSAQQLPAVLLDHADPNVAEAAQALLAANSLHRNAHGFTYQALRPELLHQLCWRLVAAMEVTSGSRNTAVVANARALLANYDEGRTAQAAARKLVHFLDNEHRTGLLDPDNTGIHLYVAYLASVLDIDQDHVLHLIDSGSAAPLGVMLRGADNDAEQAMAAIYRFKGFSLTPRDVGLFEQGFERLEPEVARSAISGWASARAKYLIFPQGATNA